jgi:hypothetical protein
MEISPGDGLILKRTATQRNKLEAEDRQFRNSNINGEMWLIK